MAVRRVAELDEDDRRQSAGRGAARAAPISRACSAARPAATARRPPTRRSTATGGPAPSWARSISPAVTHAYGGAEPARRAATISAASVSRPTLLVHPQDDRERDLLDGDGVADFAGGFAAAAALLGNEPELYHLDTSQTAAPKARRIAEEIARVVRGRLTNPRWLAGMLGARPSRRRRDRPGRRCALCLRRDQPRRAGPSVRCHARRADRRRGRAGGHDGEESGGDRGDRRAAARCPGARALGRHGAMRSITSCERAMLRPAMNSAASAQVKGWCPGVLRPMLSGDGLIVRVRPCCGAFSLEQARGLADLAAAAGQRPYRPDAARQPAAARPVGGALARAARRARRARPARSRCRDRGARNSWSRRWPGLDPAEALDVRPIARAIDDALAADERLHALPGKFGLLVDGGGAVSIAAERADVCAAGGRRVDCAGHRYAIGNAMAGRHVAGCCRGSRTRGGPRVPRSQQAAQRAPACAAFRPPALRRSGRFWRRCCGRARWRCR